MQRASNMKPFWLERTADASGVSGTGIVAEGVIYTSGAVVLSWLTAFNSVAVYPSIEELEAIHGHGGMTKVVYENPYV